MRHNSKLSLVQRSVRAWLCADCPRQSPGAADPDQPRHCEHRCPMFQALDRLRGLAVTLDPMLSPFSNRVGRAAHVACAADGSAAPERADRLTRLLGELTTHR